MRKDVREVVDEAERQGWRVRLLSSGHVMLFAPDGETKVVLAGTPSDHHSLKNGIAKMRQAGFHWPPKRS